MLVNDECNILTHLIRYSGLINRVYLYLHHRDDVCTITENKYNIIETRCGLTSELITDIIYNDSITDVIEYYLTPERQTQPLMKSYQFLSTNDFTDKLYSILYSTGVVKISIDTAAFEYGKDKIQWITHVINIIKHGNTFYVLQSYVFRYKLIIHNGTFNSIENFIKKLVSLFKKNFISKYDSDTYKQLFNDDISQFIDYKISVSRSTHVLYDNIINTEYSLLNLCSVNLVNYYNKALNKLKDINNPNLQNLYDLTKAFLDIHNPIYVETFIAEIIDEINDAKQRIFSNTVEDVTINIINDDGSLF